jgi:predicted metal-dependent hydrolase
MDRAAAHELIERLKLDAHCLARAFGLEYRSIDAERAGVRRRLGVCYADGAIRIRLFHATTGRPLKYSSLVDTLCHELAHLRHFNHGARFQVFYRRILEHARRAGIYRPGREQSAAARLLAPLRPSPFGRALPPRRAVVAQAPEQLALF